MKKTILLTTLCSLSVFAVENDYFSLLQKAAQLISQKTKEVLKDDKNKEEINSFLSDIESHDMGMRANQLKIIIAEKWFQDKKLRNLFDKIKSIMQENIEWKIAEKFNYEEKKLALNILLNSDKLKDETKIAYHNAYEKKFKKIIDSSSVQNKEEYIGKLTNDGYQEATQTIKKILSTLT